MILFPEAQRSPRCLFATSNRSIINLAVKLGQENLFVAVVATNFCDDDFNYTSLHDTEEKMSRAENKAARLLQIENLLLAHPEGLTQSQIAERVQVDRSSITRYIPDFPKHIYYDEDDGRRWKVDRTTDLINVCFNLHEATAVHLASRLLATRMDKQNPHAASTLRKLGFALERIAPHISHHLSQSADVMDTAAQRHDPNFLRTLEQLTLAWAEGRKVKIWHRQNINDKPYSYTFSPYFIEPYAVGQSVHVIGFREPPEAIRTFKVERIERIELLNERYTIPTDFEPRDLLKDAWGIWYTEAEPVRVVLKFHPSIVQRIKETRWHASEKITDLPNGTLLWEARIAEPKEMLPWIRGFGAEVEVLEPEQLRTRLIGEIRGLMETYHLHRQPLLMKLVAKWNEENKQYHALLWHMIDVGQVALQMWNTVLSEAQKKYFSERLGLPVFETGQLLAFWVSLHDMGKASPAFQSKLKTVQTTLIEAGITFPDITLYEARPHGLVTAWTLPDLLFEQTNLSLKDSQKISQALGGHHGIWPTSMQMNDRQKISNMGSQEWQALRLQLFNQLCDVFNPPEIGELSGSTKEINVFLTMLSGFVTTADWVGSMETYFPYNPGTKSCDEYVLSSVKQAESALLSTGWITWKASKDMIGFEKMFPFPPNMLQAAFLDATRSLKPPFLTIVEMPTGSGKTEAALYLADRTIQQFENRGLYIAMPTIATSNQMFSRVKAFLENRYPSSWINLQLAYGAAKWSPALKDISLTSIAEDDLENPDIAALTWFYPRKRTLLAPFGVGTVDQALISILQTSHFFLRLFGLSGKVVIFDEVHAYDVYMSTLFKRLLRWLHALGTSVIILSATLPEKTRQELAAAYLGEREIVLNPADYPRITCVSQSGAETVHFPPPPARLIALEYIDTAPDVIAERLKTQLQNGGCAAVICNTVKRAQEVYEAVRKAGIVAEEDIILFHARFPALWREGIEETVLNRFGPKGKRPYQSIVVATQVIEQSLDLDFDIMITDLAPIDLLIQRVGRLHRHQRLWRPSGLENPVVIVSVPTNQAPPDFGSSIYIYDSYLLLRTYYALRGKTSIIIPGEITSLIEQVYGTDELDHITEEEATLLKRKRSDMEKSFQKDEAIAKTYLIDRPESERLLGKNVTGLKEEAPEIHSAFRAMTRLIPPGVSLVCFFQLSDGTTTLADGKTAFDPQQVPSDSEMEMIFKSTVSVHDYRIVEYFLGQGAPAAWRKTAALRNHYPVIFKEGKCTLNDITLSLSKQPGLEILEVK